LLIAVDQLKGVRVEQRFTPSAKGAAPISACAELTRRFSKRHGPEEGAAEGAPMASAPATDACAMPMRLTRRHEPGEMAPAATGAPSTTPVAPAAAPGNYAVTFGVGMNNQEINDALATKGLYIMGAEHGEVAVAGGWAQCAGHGPMTGIHGLGADNVLEFQGVTADGKPFVANQVSNPDLFWAMRGGCGSTYGIVTQSTVKAYPSPRMSVIQWWVNSTAPAGIYAPAAYIHSQFPELQAKGVQGYYNIYPTGAMKGVFHMGGAASQQAALKAAWTPVIERLETMQGVTPGSVSSKYVDYADFKTYYDVTWGAAEGMEGMADEDMKRFAIRDFKTDRWTQLQKRHGPEGDAPAAGGIAFPQSFGRAREDSRLLGAAELKSPRLAAAMQAVMPEQGILRGGLIGGSGVMKSTARNSVNPAWRKAYVSLASAGGLKDWAPMRALAPGMGVYPNEVSPTPFSTRTISRQS